MKRQHEEKWERDEAADSDGTNYFQTILNLLYDFIVYNFVILMRRNPP